MRRTCSAQRRLRNGRRADRIVGGAAAVVLAVATTACGASKPAADDGGSGDGAVQGGDDDDGLPAGDSTVIIPADTQPPHWPPNAALRRDAVGAAAITLSWDAANDDVGVRHYRVFVDDVETAVTEARRAVVEVLPGDHVFRVEAVDFAGNVSIDGPTLADAVHAIAVAPAPTVPPEIPAGPPPHIPVEVMREFVCRMANVGTGATIATVEGGDPNEGIIIRPAGDDCLFHVFHRSEAGHETQLTTEPGGYQIAAAAVVPGPARVICASDAAHTAVPGAAVGLRRAEHVRIACWAGEPGSFSSAATAVPEDPSFAAWAARVEAHPTEAETVRLVWVRDFTFQFMNVSDAGRPATDGTYETTISLSGGSLTVGATAKLTDSTFAEPVGVTGWEPTAEERALLGDLFSFDP